MVAFDSTKSSKSVTFPDNPPSPSVTPPEIGDNQKQDKGTESKGTSVSKTLYVSGPASGASTPAKSYDVPSPEDGDLWFAFLLETGLIDVSEISPSPSVRMGRRHTTIDNPESILQQLSFYQKTHAETISTTVRDDYEGIHLLCPGLFHDTIVMDDPKEAFRKAKRIIKDIVNSQSRLGPMFDIDFANNLDYYPTVKERLEDIRQEIAPRQIFH